MDKNRGAAFRTLLSVEEEKAYSNIELNKQLAESGADDPAFVRELVYGTLKRKLLLDHYLRQLVTKGYDRLPAACRTILRMGADQILFMDSVPSYAAVNTSMELAKRFAARQAGLTNAVLRNLDRRRGTLKRPEAIRDTEKRLSVQYSVSPDIVRMWVREFGEERAESLLAASAATPPLFVTVNTCRTSRESLAEELTQAGAEAEIDPRTAHTLRVRGSGILAGEAFRAGKFFVQDIASVLAVEALAPAPGESILDVCSAPGGKSKLAAVLMEDKGSVQSFDIYPHKIRLMEKDLARLGLRSVTPAIRDALAKDAPETMPEGGYDRVICDVPCSGLGVLARKPELRYKNVSKEQVELTKIQYTIIRNAAGLVKAGGALLYSTCTVMRQENGDLVRRFLAESPDGGCFRIEQERQLLPDTDDADGFYYCILRKA